MSEMTEWNWMNEIAWLIDWLIDWLIGWLIGWLIDCLIDWLVDWLFDWLVDWLFDWLVGWLSEWMNEWVNEWMNKWMNEWMHGWMNEWMKEWLNEWMNKWMNERTNEWTNERMNGWMDGWMNEWRNAWMSFKKINYQEIVICRPHLPKVPWLWPCQILTIFTWNGALATVSCAFCRPHLPKVLRTRQFLLRFLSDIELSLQSCAHFVDLIFQKCSGLDNLFDDFYVKSSSCYSPAHFVDHFLRSSTETLLRQPRPPLYTKKCRASRPRVSSSLISRVPDLSRFPTTYIMMWLPCLATVSCTFCRPHLPKSAPDPTIFLTIFMWNRALATVQSCPFCRPLSPIEPRNRGNGDPPSRQPRPPLYPKKCRVSRPRVSSSLISRVPDLSHFQITYIMMRLPWWLMKSSSRYSLVHLLSTSSSKSAPDPTVFWCVLRFLCEIELSLQSCAHLSTIFPDQAAKPRKRPRQPLYPKKKKMGCAPESLFKLEFTHSRSLTLPLHDDVAAMMIEVMMWLPSWWES